MHTPRTFKQSNNCLATLAKRMLALALGFSLVSITASAQEQEKTGMTQSHLEEHVRELATESDGQAGNLVFIYNSIQMQLISDVSHNRMRIVAPIGAVDDVDQEQLYAMMISNYHLALDARYAFGNGVLYSVYIHPLYELSEEQVHSAVRQVAGLVATFGKDYTSGELSFGTQQRGQKI